MLFIDAKNIINNGTLLGQGRIRKTFEYEGKVYKFSITRDGAKDNRNEFILSNIHNKNFLNKVANISSDGRIIEVEKCIELGDFCNSIGIKIKSYDLYDSDIDEVVERYPKLKEFIDYTFEEVKEFLIKVGLDIKECFNSFNWMYNPRLNKIVCSDFGE